AGYKIESTTLQDEGQQEDATWSAKLGRPDGAKKIRDLITVLASKADPSDDSDNGYQPVDVNGHRGKQADTPLTGAIVSWEQSGFELGVLAPPGKIDDAMGVARAVRVGNDLTQTRIDTPPAGLEVIAEWGSTGFVRKQYSINAETTDASGRIESVRISVTVVPADFPVTILGAGHDFDASDKVRGHGAYLFRSANDIGGRSFEQFSLVWGERADLVVSIAGSVSGNELRAIAKGLKEESEPEWRTNVKVQ
ncbi:MAG: hypothetical protein Q8K63_00510, partial [Acidimicrobiales bacterium]|nr:hypothetical protein [Acidimicrobiales bacterium]